MIEWVPIKDFELKPIFGSFLILVRSRYGLQKAHTATYSTVGGHGFDRFIYVADDLFFSGKPPYTLQSCVKFSGYEVTHAAPLNFPVDKTLEEKFEEFRADVNKGTIHAYDLKGYTYSLAQIAKQHYEGGEK